MRFFYFFFYLKYKGKEYKYHEPVQSPISPPYATALSLLENKDTDFRKADVSVVIENEGPPSLAKFKKRALSKMNFKSDTESDTEVSTAMKSAQDETVTALQTLFTSKENVPDN